MRNLSLIASAALLISVPVVPALFAQTPEGASAKDRTVCKTRQKTGTRFASRTCRSLRHWEQMEDEHKRGAAEIVNRPMIEVRRGN